MDQYNITLRNLYRILTVNDYPIFSNGVLTKKYRSGLTLMSFWRQVLAPEWQEGVYGKELWDREKGRYASDFCNLKDTVPFYEEYREEVLHTLDPGLLLEQIGRIASFLNEHRYHEDVFFRKFEFLINASQENGLLSKQDCRFFLKHYCEGTRKELSPLFCDAWIFTMMMICAMCGNSAGTAQFVRQVEEREYDPRSLDRFESDRKAGSLPLQRKSKAVFGAAEDAALFFGRERELYDLTEAVNQKQKIFITGIGGIGKTELLRQLHAHFSKTHRFQNCVAVPYAGSLRSSLAGCFSSLQSEDPDQAFHECLYLMGSVAPDSLILTIDNAEIAEEELPFWQELAELKCPVVVTSRENAPEGFAEIRLEELQEHAALLLMRRHYQKTMTEREKDLLIQSIPRYRFLQHPLTIRLIALSANRSDWSIDEIIERSVRSAEEALASARYPQIKRIYRSLYREEKLSEEEKQLCRVLSALPYRQYTAEQLQAYALPDLTAGKVREILSSLSGKGWIEGGSERHSMHPLIAECLREDGFPAEVFDGLFRYLKDQLESVGSVNFMPLQTERDLLQTCENAICAACSIRGGLDPMRLKLLLSAILEGYSMMPISAKDIAAAKKLLGDVQMQPVSIQLLWQLTAMLLHEPFDSKQTLSLMQRCGETGELTEQELVDLHLQFVFNAFLARIPQEDVESSLSRVKAMVSDPFSRLKTARCEFSYYAVGGRDVQKILDSFEDLEEVYQNSSKLQSDRFARATMAYAYALRATVSLLLGDVQSGKRYYAQGKKLGKVDRGSNLSMTELNFETLLARTEGDLKTAIEKGRENVELTRKFFGEQNFNFLNENAELAIVLNQAGQTEEAIAIYRDIIQQAKVLYPGLERLALWLNNLAVAYLTKEDPDAAIEALQDGLQYLNEENLVGKAESACNFAKAYRQLGDPVREKEYLLQAQPVFSTVYASGHPKTIYVEERLKELE